MKRPITQRLRDFLLGVLVGFILTAMYVDAAPYQDDDSMSLNPKQNDFQKDPWTDPFFQYQRGQQFQNQLRRNPC